MMKATIPISVLLMLIAVSGTTPAAEYRVLEGKEKDVCVFVVERLQKSEDRISAGPENFIGQWNWEKGSYYWMSPTISQELPTLYAHYDIDNDGVKEVILRSSAMLRSHENIVIYIFKPGTIDLTKSPRLTPEILAKTPQIHSDASWPYSKHGLYYLLISPLTYRGVNYVVLMDELFGHMGYVDRKLVVARYAGTPIDPDKNLTDRLDIICKIEPIKPFIP